jgi:hypothetical protein
MQYRKSKTMMQMPDMSVSRANQDKANKIFDSSLKALRQQIKKDMKSFSTLSTVLRFIRKDKSDPNDKHVIELIKKMDRDKTHSQIALQLSETASKRLQNLQYALLIKMIPYFIGLLAMIIITSLVFATKPLSFENPVLQRYLVAFAVFLPVFIWGLVKRREAKLDMLSMNVLLQASAAFASAKMQGKGQVAAMQNLAEMRRRSKSLDRKAKANNK